MSDENIIDENLLEKISVDFPDTKMCRNCGNDTMEKFLEHSDYTLTGVKGISMRQHHKTTYVCWHCGMMQSFLNPIWLLP